MSINKNAKLGINGLLAVFILLVLGACSTSDDMDPDATDDAPQGMEDDNPDTPMDPENKTTGFVVVGTTVSGSALVKYVESIPSGTLDLSDGSDFPSFFPTALFDNALFLTRPDEQPGFSKYVVNADGELEEEGVIPTIDAGSFRMAIRDSQMGVFQDRATPNAISVFNPETMQVTGTIDMSAGFVPGDIDQRYQRFVFRGDDVFAPIRGNLNGEVFTSWILHQANLGSNSFVGNTQRDGNGVSQINTYNNFGQNLTDGAGNLYIGDGGSYDGSGLPARLNKILAGSNTIDDTYVFEPAVVLNPTNVFLPTFNEINVISETKAIARVNAETPQAAVDIVLGAGGVQNLTDEQINQVFGILFTAASAKWCVLDLEAKTVTAIEGIPNVGVFTASRNFFHDGGVYVAVVTPDENAYYRYDIASGTATKAFDVTGADILGVYNIANDN